MIIKNKGKRKEKKRKKYYEAVEELEVDGKIAAVETGRVAKGVEERVELFVGGSTVEELEVDGRVASVEAGRVAKGVEVVELFVGGLAVDELEVDDRVAAVEAGRLTEGVDEKIAEGVDERIEQFVGGCIPVVLIINSIISSQKNSLVIEMLTNYDITSGLSYDNCSGTGRLSMIIPWYYGLTINIYIYIYIVIKKNIVIERSRDLIYLKFVATDFSRK